MNYSAGPQQLCDQHHLENESGLNCGVRDRACALVFFDWKVIVFIARKAWPSWLGLRFVPKRTSRFMGLNLVQGVFHASTGVSARPLH